jgi:hypothetical protein
MKLSLTEYDINLKQEEDGTFSFRLNGDIRCEKIPTKEAALKYAEQLSKTLIRQFIKK